MADPGGALCGSACWQAAYQNYLKYQQLADNAGNAYNGHLQEYAAAQAAAYYNWSQQDAVQNIVHSENMAAARFGDLVRNGYYGQEAAASAAADAGGPAAVLSFSLLGGAPLSMDENVPSGENLAYTETPQDTAAGPGDSTSEAGISNFIGKKYQRPSGATTPAQRASVQGKPCVDCGQTGPRMYADHKVPLVVEYYTTGTIDEANMRSLDAVQPQCPACSNAQGGYLSAFSRAMAQLLGIDQ